MQGRRRNDAIKGVGGMIAMNPCHRVEDRHVEPNRREGISVDHRADVVVDGGLEAAGVDEAAKVQKRADRDMKRIGGQGRFDRIGGICRALAQGAAALVPEWRRIRRDLRLPGRAVMATELPSIPIK